MVNKLIRDGRVAVLVSHGFGAGWYSWHYDERLLFEPTIAEMLEKNVDIYEIEKYCEKTYGNEIYYGGLDGLSIVWVPVGMRFRIEEYDGAESLKMEQEVHWITA